jgi:tetratricopeptide (TPR) repeat protein
LNRRAVFITSAAVSILLIIVFAAVLSRQRYRRRQVFHRPPAAQPVKPPPGVPRLEEWTDHFAKLEAADEWEGLSDLLDEIEKHNADLYARNALGYLHARAKIETNDPDEAKEKLRPFLANGNPYRDLALFHLAEIDDSSAVRQELIFGFPSSIHRDEAIDDETEFLARGNDVNALVTFTSKLYASAPTARRRDLEAHIAEMMIRLGQTDAGVAKALDVLRGGTLDDPSDRVARALDHPDLVRRLNAAQLTTLGETLQNHRHFDRAVALLLTVPKSDDVIFSIGRSYYGDEKFAEARDWYVRGANATRDPKQKVTFLWHAARAVQLMGDDAGAERLMTAAIAVPVRTEATLAAVTQRMRTRLKQKRIAEANADLALARKIAPKDRDAPEAYALYMSGGGTGASPVRTTRQAGAPAPPPDIHAEPFPKFPLKETDRGSQLMAMGLFDEAVDVIPKRWPLASNGGALTQSLAFNRAGASRQSIYAAEVLAKRVGEKALPRVARELLYPRYFYDFIVEDSKKFGADPNLVLAIMREESRFNPRAKSEAAARGLLQFIITTARDIGRDVGLVDVTADDLYDPRIVIRLGTKYIATLSEELGGNKYAVVAAYNAGPKQVALWQRLAPKPGDDYFVRSINFDETRDYVRKVMGSYKQYNAIY